MEISLHFNELGKVTVSAYFEKLKLDIGIICDEFLYHS